jgi:hypothetical protein
MNRTTFLAFALAIALAANAPANEPTNELEDIALNVIHTAYCVGDYDTVETLFDKLSADGKKKFLQKVTVSAPLEMQGDPAVATMLDSMIQMALTTQKEESHLDFIREVYLPAKIEQTQLLGRLTLSLFEQSATEKPQAALDSKAYYVVFQSPAVGERVLRFPFTGKETVLDALSNSDLQPNASQRIWIARRVVNSKSVAVLPVNWEAITVREETDTNYQILPDDRVNVVEKGEQPQAVLQPVKPVRLLTRGNEIDIHVNENLVQNTYPNFADGSNPHNAPIISVKLPHLENAQQINGRYTIGSDGCLTFGYGGRAYVDGLTVDKCRDASEFHFSKHKVLPQPQPHAPFAVQVPVANEKPAVVW